MNFFKKDDILCRPTNVGDVEENFRNGVQCNNSTESKINRTTEENYLFV